MKLDQEILSFLAELDEAILVYHSNNRKRELVFSNSVLNHFVGKKLNKQELQGFSLANLIHPEDKNSFEVFEKKIDTKRDKEVIQVKLINIYANSFLWVKIQGVSKINDQGQLLIYYSIRDIDAQIISEHLLSQSEQKHRLLFTRANDAIFIIKDLQIVECNEKTLAMFESPGYSGVSGEKLYRFMPDMQIDGSDSILQFHYHIQEAINGYPQFFYWEFAKFGGQQFESEVSLSGFKLDDEDFVQVIVRDITARKKAEREELRAQLAERNNKKLQKEIEVRVKAEQELKKSEAKLRESVGQKEVLLREVHHRVKNNLQVINSILKLQSMHINDESTVLAIQDCQERIKTMAFIHESLYQSNDLAKVNFSEYLRTLCNNLMFSYQVDTNKVKLVFDVNKVNLSLDTGISCGLIVNELISNSLKHAFKNKASGEIKVMMSETKTGHILSIEDNGQGIPAAVNYKKTNSLGFQLVLGLTDQIDGKIQLKSKEGAKFIINFNRR